MTDSQVTKEATAPKKSVTMTRFSAIWVSPFGVGAAVVLARGFFFGSAGFPWNRGWHRATAPKKSVTMTRFSAHEKEQMKSGNRTAYVALPK
jgi:hypothetical protein